MRTRQGAFALLGMVVIAGCGKTSARPAAILRAIAPTTTGTTGTIGTATTTARLHAIALAPGGTLLVPGAARGGWKPIQVIVDGHFTDGSVRDLTRDAILRVGDPAVARVTAEGQVEGVGNGTTYVEARFSDAARGQSFSARATLVVDSTKPVPGPNATPVSLEVLPASRALTLVDAATNRDQLQQLVAVVVHSDGSREDVTRSSALEVEVIDATTRQPSAAAQVSASRLLRATQDGRTVDVRVSIPTLGLVGGSRFVLGRSSAPIQGPDLWKGEPLASSSNPLDVAALEALRQHRVEPAPLATDGELLRRATSDVLGRLPTEDELARFEADASPNRVERMMDGLLASPELAEHWGRDVLSEWMLGEYAPDDFRAALADDLARGLTVGEILQRVVAGNGQGPQNELPERKRFDERFVGEKRQRTWQVFQGLAGMSVRCATCHDHKLNASWNETRAQGLFSFFAETPTDALVTRTGQGPIEPAWDLGPVGRPLPKLGNDLSQTLQERRARFGELFAESSAFHRGTAHRIFARLSVPLLDPDRFLEGGLAQVVQPRLLEALERSFRDARTDLTAFLRVILTSKLYQLSSAGLTTRNDALLARRVLRRQASEVIERGVHGTIAPPVPFQTEYAFQFAFGYQRHRAVGVGQPLVLANSPRSAAGKLAIPGNAVGTLAADVDRGAITREEAVKKLYRRALTREPGTGELAAAMGAIAGAPTLEALEDVAAALVESGEFVLR